MDRSPLVHVLWGAPTLGSVPHFSNRNSQNGCVNVGKAVSSGGVIVNRVAVPPIKPGFAVPEFIHTTNTGNSQWVNEDLRGEPHPYRCNPYPGFESPGSRHNGSVHKPRTEGKGSVWVAPQNPNPNGGLTPPAPSKSSILEKTGLFVSHVRIMVPSITGGAQDGQ